MREKDRIIAEKSEGDERESLMGGKEVKIKTRMKEIRGRRFKERSEKGRNWEDRKSV